MTTTTGERLVRTGCPSHCGRSTQCGVLAHVKNGKVVKLEPADFPDPRDRRICLRGLSATQLLYHPDRLKYPMRRVGERGEGKFERISWDEALDTIAARLKDIAARHGPSSIGWVLGGPGGGPVKFAAYTRFASLTQGTRVSAWGYGDAAGPCGGIATFGAHAPNRYIAGFEDPKLNVVWGTNPGESGPFRLRPLLDAKEKGTKLVVIDPIFTVTASKADEYVGIRPGTDSALALSMIHVILQRGLHDKEFVRGTTVGPFLVRKDNGLFLRERDLVSGGSDQYMVWDSRSGQVQKSTAEGVLSALDGAYTVQGIECQPAFQLLANLAAQYPPERAAEITGVPADTIERLAMAYANARPASIYVDMGLQRTYHGDLSFRTVCTLAALTGNIIYPGDFVFNWDAFLKPDPEGPGYSRLPIMNMYDAIISGDPFPIKAVWFSFINFLNQCADTNKIINELIPRLEFIVDTELFMTATARYADIVLPVCSFLEFSDLINGPLPYVQLQQKVVEPLYECRSDISIISDLARRMGYGDYFNKTEEEFVDLLLASGHPTVAGINVERLKRGAAPINAPSKPVTDKTRFRTPSGKIEFYVERLLHLGEELPVYKEPWEGSRNPLAQKYPLVFVQVHSRFRTHSMFANNPWLLELNPEPVVDLNPTDAQARGISDGDMVLVFNDRGRAKLKAKLNDGVQPGVINITQGWWYEQFAEGNFNSLTHAVRNPAQEQIYEANMAMNDNLVEVKKA